MYFVACTMPAFTRLGLIGMKVDDHDDGSKRVKNIAAVLYLLVLIFLVGGSYLNQQNEHGDRQNRTTQQQP